jgi:hypothetical protein
MVHVFLMLGTEKAELPIPKVTGELVTCVTGPGTLTWSLYLSFQVTWSLVGLVLFTQTESVLLSPGKAQFEVPTTLSGVPEYRIALQSVMSGFLSKLMQFVPENAGGQVQEAWSVPQVPG